MKTEISKRKMFWLGLALAGVMLFAWAGAPAQNFTDPGNNTSLPPELVMPAVTKDTKIHISGSFTPDRSNSIPEKQGDIRGLLRLMDQGGNLTLNGLTITSALDPSDPSGRRLAFSGDINLSSIFGDDQGFRSASLFLDSTNAGEKGATQPRTSLGWFTAGALVHNDATMVEYGIQLGPQRDSVTPTINP